MDSAQTEPAADVDRTPRHEVASIIKVASIQTAKKVQKVPRPARPFMPTVPCSCLPTVLDVRFMFHDQISGTGVLAAAVFFTHRRCSLHTRHRYSLTERARVCTAVLVWSCGA